MVDFPQRLSAKKFQPAYLRIEQEVEKYLYFDEKELKLWRQILICVIELNLGTVATKTDEYFFTASMFCKLSL